MWKEYMKAEASDISMEAFKQNVLEKNNSTIFLNDMNTIIRKG
jgi:DNA-directed RNA polymerase delta subunit